MSRLSEKPVTTLEGLLEKLVCPRGSRKTKAYLFFLIDEGSFPKHIWVREVFDDGSGNPSAKTEQDALVAREVFEAALYSGYIRGYADSGIKACFRITERGEQEYYRLKIPPETSWPLGNS